MKIAHVARGSGSLKIRAVILTADGFEDLEVLVPYLRLLEAGADVEIAAPTRGDIAGKHGYVLAPDVLIDEVDPDAYDLLIIPGGSADGAPAVIRGLPHAQEVARSFFSANKPVASICHGPWLLVAADLVRDRHLTSYWRDGVPDDIRRAGGIWEDSAVVVDGNLVTSRWPADLAAFMSEMIKQVSHLPVDPKALLTPAEVDDALADLPEWHRAGQVITATYVMGDFPAAIDLVSRVAVTAESGNHHPDIDIRWRSVRFLLTTHEAGGLSGRDVAMARQIRAHASVAGWIPPDHS
ncbi:MAG: 4a-hydroxytetrahydrobiopterin dehydratase [Candidatus Nanopelagicales bacterium]